MKREHSIRVQVGQAPETKLWYAQTVVDGEVDMQSPGYVTKAEAEAQAAHAYSIAMRLINGRETIH